METIGQIEADFVIRKPQTPSNETSFDVNFRTHLSDIQLDYSNLIALLNFEDPKLTDFDPKIDLNIVAENSLNFVYRMITSNLEDPSVNLIKGVNRRYLVLLIVNIISLLVIVGLVYQINILVRNDLQQMALLLLRIEKNMIHLYIKQYDRILD